MQACGRAADANAVGGYLTSLPVLGGIGMLRCHPCSAFLLKSNVCACVRRQVKITISERDQFVLMGCDGFWRVFTNQARRAEPSVSRPLCPCALVLPMRAHSQLVM